VPFFVDIGLIVDEVTMVVDVDIMVVDVDTMVGVGVGVGVGSWELGVGFKIGILDMKEKRCDERQWRRSRK
jgi:hypothetical protein